MAIGLFERPGETLAELARTNPQQWKAQYGKKVGSQTRHWACMKAESRVNWTAIVGIVIFFGGTLFATIMFCLQDAKPSPYSGLSFNSNDNPQVALRQTPSATPTVAVVRPEVLRRMKERHISQAQAEGQLWKEYLDSHPDIKAEVDRVEREQRLDRAREVDVKPLYDEVQRRVRQQGISEREAVNQILREKGEVP